MMRLRRRGWINVWSALTALLDRRQGALERPERHSHACVGMIIRHFEGNSCCIVGDFSKQSSIVTGIRLSIPCRHEAGMNITC